MNDFLSRRVDDLDDQINSTDPTKPGLALRMDRTERELALIIAGIKSLGRTVRWVVSGGGLGSVAMLAYLFKLADAMSKL